MRWKRKREGDSITLNYKVLYLVFRIQCVSIPSAVLVHYQQYVNQELSDVQAGFRKGKGTRDQIANICWITERAREFQKKTSTSASLTMLKSLIVCITTNCRKLLKRWECQITSLAPEKPVCGSRSNS